MPGSIDALVRVSDDEEKSHAWMRARHLEGDRAPTVNGRLLTFG